MEKYIGHRLVTRPKPDNIFWTDSTVHISSLIYVWFWRRSCDVVGTAQLSLNQGMDLGKPVLPNFAKPSNLNAVNSSAGKDIYVCGLLGPRTKRTVIWNDNDVLDPKSRISPCRKTKRHCNAKPCLPCLVTVTAVTHLQGLYFSCHGFKLAKPLRRFEAFIRIIIAYSNLKIKMNLT